MNKLTVIDVFCGSGGFSEGFRQQGFTIKLGIDSWKPAIDTFNHNFGLKSEVKNVLDFRKSIKEIEALPDTDIIIGSPPCVSFSHSNLSGKADKSSGVLLTKIFLRIVAVKKFKKGSQLKAWYMENVTNSTNYLNDYYTFKDLGLTKWAQKNGHSPQKKAIILEGNQSFINSADYGSTQKRTRVISGEIVRKRGKVLKKGRFSIPPRTHRNSRTEGEQPFHKPLSIIKNGLPKPNQRKSNKTILDPQYDGLKLNACELSDHFYDTGLYACEWKQSEHYKTNHPYMGIMSFPENEDRPSRTITATKIGSSREAIIYRSEFHRIDDGEYRTPTVREAACIMGFPITFQFKGSEGTKWRLVGNAVCPTVSRAFARHLRHELGLPAIERPIVQSTVNSDGIINLNSYSEKAFNNRPKRNKNSRFRRQPFKDGNITVTLSNYDIVKKDKNVSRWITSVQYGNGDGFPTYIYPDETHLELEPLIRKSKSGIPFLEIINNGFSEKIAKCDELQRLYESQASANNLLEPTELVKEVANIINALGIDNETFKQNGTTIFEKKKDVPLKQLFALYAISNISAKVNV